MPKPAHRIFVTAICLISWKSQYKRITWRLRWGDRHLVRRTLHQPFLPSAERSGLRFIREILQSCRQSGDHLLPPAYCQPSSVPGQDRRQALPGRAARAGPPLRAHATGALPRCASSSPTTTWAAGVAVNPDNILITSGSRRCWICWARVAGGDEAGSSSAKSQQAALAPSGRSPSISRTSKPALA